MWYWNLIGIKGEQPLFLSLSLSLSFSLSALSLIMNYITIHTTTPLAISFSNLWFQMIMRILCDQYSMLTEKHQQHSNTYQMARSEVVFFFLTRIFFHLLCRQRWKDLALLDRVINGIKETTALRRKKFFSSSLSTQNEILGYLLQANQLLPACTLMYLQCYLAVFKKTHFLWLDFFNFHFFILFSQKCNLLVLI